MSLLNQPSISVLRRQLRTREIHASDLADLALAGRTRTVDGETQSAGVGPFGASHLTDDTAFLATARRADTTYDRVNPPTHPGYLCGIPMSVKSVISVSGYPCYAGCDVPLPDSWSADGAMIAGLRSQLAPIASITHASELSVGGLGVNAHYPTPRNPWDALAHRVPGGSSAGAAISLWEGIALFALGTDTGGSVRVPASAAGLVGLKTSNGLWPVDGVVPLASGYDTIGVITRSVADASEVYTGMQSIVENDSNRTGGIAARTAGAPDPDLSEFRFIKASAIAWSSLDDGIEDAVNAAMEELCANGMSWSEDPHDLFERAAQLRDQGPNTAAFECRQLVQKQFPSMWEHLSVHVREFLETAADVSQAEIDRRLAVVTAWRAQANKCLQSDEILFCPTLKLTPPTVECVEKREPFSYYSDGLLHNTVLASMNGFCAMTLPVGLDAQAMPVGLQLCARHGNEKQLIRAAQAIENCLGTSVDRLGLPPLVQRLSIPVLKTS